MANSKRAPKKKKAVRTTISLNPTVHEWAEELQKAEGHNSLSDLIADLIRRHKDAKSGRSRQDPEPPKYNPEDDGDQN